MHILLYWILLQHISQGRICCQCHAMPHNRDKSCHQVSGRVLLTHSHYLVPKYPAISPGISPEYLSTFLSPDRVEPMLLEQVQSFMPQNEQLASLTSHLQVLEDLSFQGWLQAYKEVCSVSQLNETKTDTNEMLNMSCDSSENELGVQECWRWMRLRYCLRYYLGNVKQH